jgi:hypothetical protein
MKKFSLLLCSAVILYSCNDKQVQVNSIAISKNFNSITPAQLIGQDGQQWVAYESAATENSNNEIFIDKASFDKSGHFKIVFTEKNIEGHTGGGYTVVEGNADFTKTENGNNVITLHPQKGMRKINNGNTSAIQLNNNELQIKFAIAYLWEKISFSQMPSEDFLILAKPGINGKADKSTAVKLRLQ